MTAALRHGPHKNSCSDVDREFFLLFLLPGSSALNFVLISVLTFFARHVSFCFVFPSVMLCFLPFVIFCRQG